MTLTGAIVLGLVIAATVLVVAELTRERASFVTWAVFLVALAELVDRLA